MKPDPIVRVALRSYRQSPQDAVPTDQQIAAIVEADIEIARVANHKSQSRELKGFAWKTVRDHAPSTSLAWN